MNTQRRLVALALAASMALACGGLTPGGPTATVVPVGPATTGAPTSPALTPTSAVVGLSQAEAQAIVLEQVVQPVAADDPIIVFAWPQPLTSADRLQAYPYPSYEPVPSVAAINGESWFFWVDDEPNAFYAHGNRFVLVERASGAVSVWEENWWPTLNGQGLWVESDDYWNEAHWAFSQGVSRPHGPPGAAASHSGGGLAARMFEPVPQLENPGSAVVINGYRDGEQGKEYFDIDTEAVLEVLADSGFDTALVTVRPDQHSDTATEAFVNTLDTYMKQQAAGLKAGDTFVVYLEGHGFNENGTGRAGGLTETQMAAWLAAFKPGVHVIVVVMACFSGAFLDGLAPVADLVITSTSHDRYSFFDMDPIRGEGPSRLLDPNENDEGSEFTSGLVEDWKIIEADEDLKWALRITNDPPGSNYWQRLFRASLNTEMVKDAAYLNGLTRPSFVWGSGILNPPQQRVEVGGVLDAVIYAIRDIAQHLGHIRLPSFFTLNVRRGSIIFDGPDPWVDVTGEWQPDGSFEAQGLGTVAGFPNVTVTFTGTLTTDGLLGYYTMGAGGELPQGEPIVYQVDGVWLAREDAPREETLDEFLTAFAPALQRNHQTFLFERLHPAVLERYGAEQCQTFMANRGAEVDLNIERTGDLSVGAWDWVLDERTTTIEDVATVPVNFTRAGETSAVELHFGILEGRLYWFTDCGDPIP